MTKTTTYMIVIRPGYSAYDHLAPIGVQHGTYRTLAEAKAALDSGRKAQGACLRLSRQVRCDIVRSDGKRWDWA